MKRLTVLLALFLASSAWAGNPTNPDFTREQQGGTLQIDYRALAAATSACAIAPTGTTCTGGVNYAVGALRSVTVENIGTGDVYCDETSPAVASQGILLGLSGGSATFDRALLGITLYCISTAGSTLAIVQEK